MSTFDMCQFKRWRRLHWLVTLIAGGLDSRGYRLTEYELRENKERDQLLRFVTNIQQGDGVLQSTLIISANDLMRPKNEFQNYMRDQIATMLQDVQPTTTR